MSTNGFGDSKESFGVYVWRMRNLSFVILISAILSGCAGDIPLQRKSIVRGARAAIVGERAKVKVHFLSQLAPHEVLVLLDGLRADEFAKEMGDYDISKITAREAAERLKGSPCGVIFLCDEFHEMLASSAESGESADQRRDRASDYAKVAEALDLRYLLKMKVTPELELEWLPKQVLDPSLFGKVYPVLSVRAEMIDLSNDEVVWRRSKRRVNDKILHTLDEYQSNNAKLAKASWESIVPALLDELLLEFFPSAEGESRERSIAEPGAEIE